MCRSWVVHIENKQILLFFQPLHSLVVLALGAVAIATGMILVLGLITGLTSIDVPSQERGATAFNGAHRLAVAG